MTMNSKSCHKSGDHARRPFTVRAVNKECLPLTEVCISSISATTPSPVIPLHLKLSKGHFFWFDSIQIKRIKKKCFRYQSTSKGLEIESEFFLKHLFSLYSVLFPVLSMCNLVLLPPVFILEQQVICNLAVFPFVRHSGFCYLKHRRHLFLLVLESL